MKSIARARSQYYHELGVVDDGKQSRYIEGERDETMGGRGVDVSYRFDLVCFHYLIS